MKRDEVLSVVSRIADKLDAVMLQRGVTRNGDGTYQADLRTMIDNMMTAIDQIEQSDDPVTPEETQVLASFEATVAASLVLILEAFPFRIDVEEITFEQYPMEKPH